MADVVNQYFAAYRASDYEVLSALWHPDFEFSDPAFPDLKGKNAKAMFHMFATNAQKTQMAVTPSPAEPVPGQDGKFKVEYTCDYVYGSQKVHNPITAIVEIKDGKVFRQTDDFDFGGWAKQALGLVVGSGLYYLGLLPGTVQKKAADRLKGWCDTHEEFKE